MMELVSVIIPCHNPKDWLLETIESARAQDYARIEVILVDDGSQEPESKCVLARAAQLVDNYIQQEHRGVSAARNAAIAVANGSFFVPLDCQDLLEPPFVSACLDSLKAHPEAAFAYTDYRVFGERNYAEALPDFNLFELLHRNTLPYACVMRAEDCRAVQGYDPNLPAYEDWDLWLRLASRGRYGHHLSRVLWAYRKCGRSLSDFGREHHDQLVEQIRSKHGALYGPGAYAQIKARWQPSVCVVGHVSVTEQTIRDWEAVDCTDMGALLTMSRAPVFLFPRGDITDSQALELAVLAAAGQRTDVALPDGSVVTPRQMLKRNAGVASRPRPALVQRRPTLGVLWRHLSNAELHDHRTWLRHPLRSASRLIPLRLKERVNKALQRPVFDLSFYLQFQPQALVLKNTVVSPIRYLPTDPTSRRRIAFLTPHLGPGGAETVLLDFAHALDPNQFEILLIATQSEDSRWMARWQQCVARIYDLARVVEWQDRDLAQLSIITNWACDVLVIQNTLLCYNLLPTLKKLMPRIKVIDLVHAIDRENDIVTCTEAVSPYLDTRVAISEAVRRRLLDAGVASDRIVVAPNGVDLEHFRQTADLTGSRSARILFAGRLDEVKRPLLLVEIAKALRKLRASHDFQFVVAGDGPENTRLRSAVRRAGMEHQFEFLGQVPDLAPVVAGSTLLVITSRSEGVPLVMLEALASGRPVVASDVGAIREVLDSTTGFLIRRTSGEAGRFAAAIDTLLSDSELRRKMGERGRRVVEQKHNKVASMEVYRSLFSATTGDVVANVACAGTVASSGYPSSVPRICLP